MELESPKRPTGITITAWIWIVMGCLMILNAVTAAAAFSRMRSREAFSPPGVQLPAAFDLLDSVDQHFGAIVAIQGVFAVLAIFSGTSLLRLRPWARATIEALSWIGLFSVLVIGVDWDYSWLAATGQVTAHGRSGQPESFRWIGAMMGVVITAVFAVPLGIMIRYLRGAEVRTALRAD